VPTTSARRRRGTLLALAAVSVVAMAAVASAPLSAIASSPDARVSYAYERSDAQIANPERGLYTPFQSTDDITDESLQEVVASGRTIVHFDIDLSAYLTRHVDRALRDSIHNAFELLRKYGLKGWIHISYSPNFDPNGPGGPYRTICLDTEAIYPDVPSTVDTSLEWVQTHLRELKDILARNDDAIMGFDAGIIGEWGEWHCSAHGLLAPGTKEQVLKALLDNLPADRQIALRHPYDLFRERIDRVQGPDVTWSDASSRLTDYQDCYASEQPSDEGTWVTDLANDPRADQAEISLLKGQVGVLGENHIVGGNACRSSARSTCPVAVTGERANTGEPTSADPFPLQYDAPELPNMHFTYLNGKQEGTANQDYQDGGCWDDITKKLGYRLRLTHADLPAAVVPGATAHVEIDLANDGWASIVNPRPVFLVLDGPGGAYRIPLQADPRSWAAGEHATIDEDVSIPPDAAPGDYVAALWLPDAADVLRGKPAYSVQLANVGTWDAAEGYNVLGGIGVRASAPPADPAAASPELAASGLPGELPAVAVALSALALTAGGVLLASARRSRRGRQGL